MSKQIVVLERGWVFVGDVADDGNGGIVISNAKNVRRWGTTAGLGQLAADGPQSNTVLDPAGVVRAKDVIFRIDCDAAKWANAQ